MSSYRDEIRQYTLAKAYLEARQKIPIINQLIYGAEFRCLNLKTLVQHQLTIYLHETNPEILICMNPFGGIDAFDLKRIQIIDDVDNMEKGRKQLFTQIQRWLIIEDLSTEICLLFPTEENKHIFHASLRQISQRMRDVPSETDSEILKNFIKADKNRNRKMQYDQLFDMLKEMKIGSKQQQIRICKFIGAEKNKSIEFKQYENLSRFLSCRKQFIKDFQVYSGYKFKDPKAYFDKVMKKQAFMLFLKEVQEQPLENAKKIAGKLFTNSQDKLSFYEFCYFMLDQNNNLLTEEYLNYESDDNLPLTSYYCYSSHNTYLTGHQISSDSEASRYSEDLQVGVRCVEIDTYDGSDGPVVTHGKTLTSTVSFEDVIKSINSFSKKKEQEGHTPIIISIQNHCGQQNKKRMAEIMYKQFGNKILIIKKCLEQKDVKHFPTLCNLMNRIIVKTSASFQEYQKQFLLKNVQNYSNLMFLTSMLGAGKIGTSSVWESVSLSENKIVQAFDDRSEKYAQIEKHVKSSWIRAYPKGTRFDSSNYNPFPAIELGVQLIALNTQSEDRPTILMKTFFQKGILKTPGYRKRMTFGVQKQKNVKTITIKPISAMKIYYNNMRRKKETPPVEIRMRLYCHSSDMKRNQQNIQIKSYTEQITQNSFNPIFKSEPMKIFYTYEEFAFVIVEIQGAGRGVIPLEAIKKGYRYIELCDSELKKKESKVFFLIH